jgi:hypothetical protein
VNNSGDAAVTFIGESGRPDRGYLRTADGILTEFSPLAGHRSTYARGVSEQIGGKLYVAGISDDDNGRYNAVRWTVDVATRAVTAIEVGGAGTYCVAMANDGAAVGVISGSNTSGFVWKRGGTITALKPPKGSGSGRVWGVSSNGRHISGDARFGSYRRAVLWTEQ